MSPLLRSAVIVLAMVMTTTHAEEPLWLGAFTNEKQSKDGIDAAIETAVAKMNFVTRPIARSRLKKTNAGAQARRHFADGGYDPGRF